MMSITQTVLGGNVKCGPKRLAETVKRQIDISTIRVIPWCNQESRYYARPVLMNPVNPTRLVHYQYQLDNPTSTCNNASSFYQRVLF
jgi:hypothetical protein